MSTLQYGLYRTWLVLRSPDVRRLLADTRS